MRIWKFVCFSTLTQTRLHRYSLRPSLECSIIRWSIKYTDTLKSIHKDDNLESFGKLPRHDLAVLFVIN